MEIPRLGMESEIQLLAHTTTRAMPDLRHTCNLHHGSWQCHIPDPTSEARDWTHILMDASRICFHCAMTGTSFFIFTFKVYDPSQISVCRMRSQLILFPLEYPADPEALVQETFLFLIGKRKTNAALWAEINWQHWCSFTSVSLILFSYLYIKAK